MLIKNQMITIPEDNIFYNDILGRQQSIKDLSQLILSYNQPFVLSINADWGTGKTTFLKLWKAYLKKEHNINSIYFSAWEDDFSKEPLISILGEINNYIIKNSCTHAVKSNFEKVKTIGSKIVKRTFPAFIKGLTSGLVDVEAGYEAAVETLSEEVVSEMIQNYNREKDTLEEFKDAMNLLIKEINRDKPFVIFVDELDRCRPLYTIKLLEKLKHVFGIDNLIFVLAIDKEQLMESIKSQYGQINADKYLKRFIDLEYNLKNVKLDIFCDYLYHKYEFDAILRTKGLHPTQSDYHHLTIMKKLISILNLPLRDIEQIFTKLLIVFRTLAPGANESLLRVFILFEMLKAYDSSMYREFVTKQNNIDIIKQLILPKLREGHSNEQLIAIVEASLDSVGKNSQQYQELIVNSETILQTLVNNHDTSSQKYKELSKYIHLLKHSYGGYGDYYFNDLVQTVIDKLDFVDEFNMTVVQ